MYREVFVKFAIYYQWMAKYLLLYYKICVNKIPSSISVKHLPEIFEVIKGAQIPYEPNYPLCWYFEN